ncbi:MAG TPA: OmpH family outer membrane protein, partial [Nitrospirae bacterium]|nr:OmpH family outer membrane protein [Nitrospirota bacterium]
MKKVFLLAFIFAFGIFSAHAADLKIGYLDFHKALNESNEGKKASKVLEDMISKKEKIFNGKKEEIKKLDEELKKQASVLTPETTNDKQENLSKLYRDYQRMVKDFQEELKKKEADLRQVIEKDLFKIIIDIGKEDG